MVMCWSFFCPTDLEMEHQQDAGLEKYFFEEKHRWHPLFPQNTGQNCDVLTEEISNQNHASQKMPEQPNEGVMTSLVPQQPPNLNIEKCLSHQTTSVL